MNQILQQRLDRFLAAHNGKAWPAKVAWVRGDHISVYLRLAQRSFDEALQPCLDMASIEIDRAYRGKGRFSQVMEYLERHNPTSILYVESVLNDIAADWCERNGYTRCPETNSYWKMTKCESPKEAP